MFLVNIYLITGSNNRVEKMFTCFDSDPVRKYVGTLLEINSYLKTWVIKPLGL